MKYIAFMRAETTLVVILYYPEREKSVAARVQMDMIKLIGHVWTRHFIPNDGFGIEADHYVVQRANVSDLFKVEEIMKGYCVQMVHAVAQTMSSK